MEIPGRTWKFQVARTSKLSFVKGPPMPRWLRRPFVASRSSWVGGLCRRSIAGWLLAGWLVSKKEATERRAHDPNNPKSPNASPAARHGPRRYLVSRRAADGCARGVRSTRSESAQQQHAAPAACRRTTTDDRRPANDTRRPPRRNERSTAISTATEARHRGVTPHGARRSVAGGCGGCGACLRAACEAARDRGTAQWGAGEGAVRLRRQQPPKSNNAVLLVRAVLPSPACGAASSRCSEVPRCPPTECGRVIEFWMCQHRHIQK